MSDAPQTLEASVQSLARLRVEWDTNVARYTEIYGMAFAGFIKRLFAAATELEMLAERNGRHAAELGTAVRAVPGVLTVERLAGLLDQADNEFGDEHTPYVLAPQELAAWLLPRLGAGPEERRPFVTCRFCDRADLVPGGTHYCRSVGGVSTP